MCGLARSFTWLQSSKEERKKKEETIVIYGVIIYEICFIWYYWRSTGQIFQHRTNVISMARYITLIIYFVFLYPDG
jgi:hypothetical protein